MSGAPTLVQGAGSNAEELRQWWDNHTSVAYDTTYNQTREFYRPDDKEIEAMRRLGYDDYPSEEDAESGEEATALYLIQSGFLEDRQVTGARVYMSAAVGGDMVERRRGETGADAIKRAFDVTKEKYSKKAAASSGKEKQVNQDLATMCEWGKKKVQAVIDSRNEE